MKPKLFYCTLGSDAGNFVGLHGRNKCGFPMEDPEQPGQNLDLWSKGGSVEPFLL